MIWQRRRRNQPVDEGAFQEMWAVLPGTSKRKKGTLKKKYNKRFFRNTTSVGSRKTCL